MLELSGSTRKRLEMDEEKEDIIKDKCRQVKENERW